MTNSAMRRSLIASKLAVVLTCIIACSPASEEPVAVEPVEAESPLQPTMAEVRTSLLQQNYGTAAEQAKLAQERFPNEPDVHLLAAQAEARLGNSANAAMAFRRAIETGLQEPRAALSNAAFDGVRQSEAFERLRSEFAPPSSDGRSSPTAPSNSDRVSAGDVEIITGQSGDYVRAGDVVIDTRGE